MVRPVLEAVFVLLHQKYCLTVRQMVGLRFASDEEFAALAAWTVRQNLSEDAIKKAVTTWQPDTYRA
jgi:hypothetical protein